MNILVIGNGFDLAHGLPTKYTDFLNFIDNQHDRDTKILLKKGEIYKSLSKNEIELIHLTSDNVLLRYFRSAQIRNRWVDFETEISNVIQVVDDVRHVVNKQMAEGKKNIKIEQNQLKVLRSFIRTDLSMIDFELKSKVQRIIYSLRKRWVKYKYIYNPFLKNYAKTHIDHELIWIKSDLMENEKLWDSDIIVFNSSITIKLNERLQFDLGRLIRGLEIYLSDYVNKKHIKTECQDIKNLEIDKVLSFNYTNTYERLYDSNEKQIEYDYIHGKADVDNTRETNNMVLGIDEYLPDDRKNKDVEFIAFKKYYQRIYKGTGSEYKDWINEIREENDIYMERKHDCEIFLKNGQGFSNEIDEIRSELKRLNENPPRHNLYIFGHSLDITDKDVLRDLILNDNVYTTIFYPDKKELGRKIANLVKVIGQDELIRRTGGSTRTIEFKLQQKMEPLKSQQSEENRA